MRNKLVSALAAVLLLPAASALAVCTENGGRVDECHFKWAAQPRQPIGGWHGSGDTFALDRATCVTADSGWGFHSSRDFWGRPSAWGNQFQLDHYRRFPRVQAWARRAFADGQDHTLTGAQLGRLGVPICREGW